MDNKNIEMYFAKVPTSFVDGGLANVTGKAIASHLAVEQFRTYALEG